MAAAGATRIMRPELDEDTTLKVLGGKMERPSDMNWVPGMGGGVPPNDCSARRARHSAAPPAHEPARTLRPNVSSDRLKRAAPLGSAPRHSLQPILTLVCIPNLVVRPSFAERFGTFGNSIGAGRTSRCGHGNARTKE